VWVDPAADDVQPLKSLAREAGLAVVDEPGLRSLLLVQPWGIDVTHACSLAGLDPARTVGVDPLPGLARRRTLMLSVSTQPYYRDAAHALLALSGHAVGVVGDSPGFVVQRVLATIINIAADVAQRGIASVEDIEIAVTKALGYPQGPLAWGDRIGPSRVMRILEGLHSITLDPRYRPSPWLRRRAESGLSLLTPEALR
jgi:3-hydroxybutyryl-CoA dehydrogenase